MTAQIRFNEWQKPDAVAGSADGLRLYLTKRSLTTLIRETALDDFDPSTLPDRVWVEAGDSEDQLSIKLQRRDADPQRQQISDEVRQRLVDVVWRYLSLVVVDQDRRWSRLRNQLYAQGMVFRRGKPATLPPHQRGDQADDNAPADTPKPAAGASQSRTSTARKADSEPVTVIIGRRESEVFADTLGRQPGMTIVRDPQQYGDVVTHNARGDELVVVRQRLDRKDQDDPGKTLFEHANQLGYFANHCDHRMVVLVLLEGEAALDPSKRRRQGIEGALAYLIGCDHLGVVTTASMEHSVDVITRSVRQFQRSASTVDTTDQVRALVDNKCMALETVPGVSRTMALALLDRFGSVAAVANATREQLEQVEGVGSKRAGSIQRVFQHGG